MLTLPHAAALALALAAADAAPAPAPARPLDLGAAAPSAGGVAAAVTILVALAVAALVLQRRRRTTRRLVEIVETTSLGPRRSLIVARIAGELVLLASSEAGIAVLPPRLRAPAAPGEGWEGAALDAAAGEPAASPGARLAPVEEPGGFDALLHDSAEDQELRLKLARGLGGSVR